MTRKQSEVAHTARAHVGEGVAAVYLPVAALKPNPRNPRVHGPEVLNLARTIVRTTWGAPIIAQRSTMRIIGGHGRLEAAREILAGIEVDGFLRGGAEHRFDADAPAPGLVPVRLVDVSDAEADAMTLADNAARLQGRDDAALAVEMATRSFERDAPIMADMGYGADALDKLIKKAGDDIGAELEMNEVDVSDASDARFWMSIEGHLPSQPDVLDALRAALGKIPGVKVTFV